MLTISIAFFSLTLMILEVVKGRDAHRWILSVKKIDTISTTIINILKKPRDSCLLSTTGLTDQSSHMHTNRPTDHHPLPVHITEVKEVVWKGRASRLAAAAEREGSWGVEGRTGREGRRVFRRGRGLRTSFNSTLLWKLQLPLSRLAPGLLLPLLQLRLPHQPYPLASNPGRVQASSQVGFTFRGATKPSCACLSTCAHVRLICKTFNMHEKGTLKHLVKTKKKKKLWETRLQHISISS